MERKISFKDSQRFDKSLHPHCARCGKIFTQQSLWLHHIQTCAHKAKRTVIEYGEPSTVKLQVSQRPKALPADFFDPPTKRRKSATSSDGHKEHLEVLKANKHEFLTNYYQADDKLRLENIKRDYHDLKSMLRAQPPVVVVEEDESEDDSDDSDDSDLSSRLPSLDTAKAPCTQVEQKAEVTRSVRGPAGFSHEECLNTQDVQSKVSDVIMGKEKPVEESNPEYENFKQYIFELEDHLAEAQKHAYLLVKRHRELGETLSEFGNAVKLLGACEGKALGKAFADLGTKYEALPVKPEKEAYNLLMNFEEPLKEYVRSVQSIKATMAERASAFKHQCELAETIKLKEINLGKLMLTRSDKVGEAEIEYHQLKAEGEEATRKFETIVRLMSEEIVRFQEQKTLDLGLAFHELAKGQAHLANEIANGWLSLLPKAGSLFSHTDMIFSDKSTCEL